MPEWIQSVLTSKITWAIMAVVVAYLLTLVGLIIYTWWERRGAAFIQRRSGPNRRGPYGLVQAVADAVKLAVKEDVVPAGANKWLHALAPMIIMTVALTIFAVIPWSGDFVLFGETFRLQIADLNFGIIFILAISSLAVYGVALAGWASNSKYSLLGGLRAGAQMISYEISMGLAVVGLILIYNTVKLDEMILAQSGAVWHWGIFQAPLAFIIFITAIYAETNRVPFDLVEADSEIVAGFHTEYSSLRFGLFYMGEYVHMAVAAVLIVVLFFGGWQIPWAYELFGQTAYATLFPWFMFGAGLVCLVLAWDVSRPKRRLFTKGNLLFAAILICVAFGTLAAGALYLAFDVVGQVAWLAALAGVVTQVIVLVVKFLFFFWLFIWVRWTVPRFRYDQLMKLGWKVLLPLALFNIAVTSVLVLVGWL
ncbi:MAG: NADH-quinone oxidoreductase subunit H [Deltaproteobacteria bacterium]|nr:NADH-quinone oxidoreductase subunit H [Deltaproteobacteria bacterium]